MKSIMRIPLSIHLLALLLAVPGLAQAHKFWLLPSSTVLSSEGDWITVDAARSNDMFIFNHHAMGLDNLQVHTPGDYEAEPANVHEMEIRSVFDLQIEHEGTYKMAVVDDFVFGRYEVDGEQQRWHGTADEIDSGIPDNAENVQIAKRISRAETFVTAGAPTRTTLEPTGHGLELAPKTHPNDLYAGESAQFQLLVDGDPAKNTEVTIIPGGMRYRDERNAAQLITDAKGMIEFTWPRAGLYYLEANASDDKTRSDQIEQRRMIYVATLEVLPF